MEYDVVVVGSGPNGLAAAIRMAQRGRSVLVLERNSVIGGGARTAELTLHGFHHDRCSAVHPLRFASPFLRTLELSDMACNGSIPKFRCAPSTRCSASHSASLDRGDRSASSGRRARLAEPHGPAASPLGTVAAGDTGPASPAAAPAPDGPLWPDGAPLRPGIGRGSIQDAPGPSVLAGLAAHSCLPLESYGSAAIALMLALAGHAVGWPIPRGGAQAISNALAWALRSLGGQIHTGMEITSPADLPPATCVLFDVTPAQLVRIAGDRLRSGYRRRLERYRYGPGAYKIDWALSAPIPWRDEACRRAGTVHLGGAWRKLLIPSGALGGAHGGGALCVVVTADAVRSRPGPTGKTHRLGLLSCSQRFDRGHERAAGSAGRAIRSRFPGCGVGPPYHRPGRFRTSQPELRRRRHQRWLRRGRPIALPSRDKAPPLCHPSHGREHWYFCSSSTPPGPGVHGMCGYHARKPPFENRRSHRARSRRRDCVL